MVIYAFGSICRGEIDIYSDIDLLAILEKGELEEHKLNKELFSIYSEERIKELWKLGNPFSWHLYLDSKLLYSANGNDLIIELGEPAKYNNLKKDCQKFYQLFLNSKTSLLSKFNTSSSFDLAIIFLAIRNYATCFALGFLKEFNFSRSSAIKLNQYSIHIEKRSYQILERSRILATRGLGTPILDSEVKIVIQEMGVIEKWFTNLNKIINNV